MAKKEKIAGNRVMVVNFTTTTPPTFHESNYKEWVKAGKDNKYFDDLLFYSNLSSTHRSILQTKINLMSDVKFVTKKETNFDLRSLVYKLSTDLEIFGGNVAEIIWTKSKKEVAEINHIPLQNMRFAKMLSNSKIPGMFYSRDWSNVRKNPPVFIPFYDGINKGGRQIILTKKYWAGSPYNIIPSYYGAFNYIVTDFEISKFNLNTIKKGLSPSIIISFNDGKPDPEQADNINQMIKEKFAGAEGDKLLLLFNDNKDKAAEIKILDGSDMADMYTNLSKETSQQIITAHQLTSPVLAGIRVEGSLGNATELLQANELFNKNVITPDRNLIINTLNQILQLNKNEVEIITNTNLLSSFTEEFINNITTINERRKMLGLEELKDNELKNLSNE